MNTFRIQSIVYLCFNKKNTKYLDNFQHFILSNFVMEFLKQETFFVIIYNDLYVLLLLVYLADEIENNQMQGNMC